jgi:hypothetical protein
MDWSRITQPSLGSSYGIVEFFALLFLTAPLVIFFAGFTWPYIAVPAILTIGWLLYRARPPQLSIRPDWHQAVLCAVVSALFLWACAYLPPFGRSWDWLKHFAFFNELARNPWPPVNPVTHTFLRFPLGWYLVPGLIARWFGEGTIVPMVFLETWAGLFLVLMLLLQKIRPARQAPFLIVFLLFGGLDLVGWYFWGVDRTLLSTKEWWTGTRYLFAYEGHATLFLWVPHHALAGMLGLLLLISNDGRPPAPRTMALVGVAVLFWSTFAAMGLLPFALLSAVRTPREVFADIGNILCLLVVGIPISGYLLAGIGGLPSGFTFMKSQFSIGLYVVFLALEVGLYFVALRLHGWRHLRYPVAVIAVLIVLPLYSIGIYNDFTMRACIPAIMLLAIAVAVATTEPQGIRWMPLAFLVAIGMAGSILEIIGRGNDGYVSVRDMSVRSGFLFEDHGFFIQYNAPLPNWVVRY